jgi:hypothetical protein
MKNKSFEKRLVLFLLALLVLFWMMTNAQVDTIGDFFVEAIESSSLIIALIVSVTIITKTIIDNKKSKEKNKE